MAAEIEGKEHKLSEVFSNAFAFNIPLYQRSYRWEVEHAEDLLDDLVTAMGEEEKLDDLDPYFLGSIVLVKKKHEPEAEVLDGQQRLTTLTILVAALRQVCEDSFAADLTPFLYEKGSLVTKTANRYRLTLRPRDQEFFETYVLKEGGIGELAKSMPKTETQRNIRANGLLFQKRLEGLTEELRRRLCQFAMASCYLVVVSTPDFASAYRVFAVLNDRGLDLSYTDILKADVVGAIDEAGEQEEYAKKWEEVEEQLRSEGFEQLFAQIRMIHQKSKLRASMLKEFREQIKPQSDPKGFVDNTLIPLGQALTEVANEHVEFAENVDESSEIDALLAWLGRLDHREWLAPAVLFVRTKRNDAKANLAFFRDLERLGAALMILRANRGTRIARYARVLKEIEDGGDLAAGTSSLQLAAEERKEVLGRLEGDIYFTGTRAKVTLLVLLRLDSLLSTGDASYQHKTISIEHVLPQSPSANSDWLKVFSEAEREHHTHRLGNLLLLPRRKNSQASNYEFKKKKEKYFSSQKGVQPFAITTQVLKEDSWTPDVVKARQAELIAKLSEVWRLA